jgi:capsular polysaccharide transport system ATP-binding protein
MIDLQRVRKTYPIKDQRRIILRGVSHRFEPGVNVGILGRNGAGKSTLLRLIGGEEAPDSGRVLRSSRVSWPIGFSGCFHGQLSGRANLRFVSRIYGASVKKVAAFVDDFAELGPYMDMPVKVYSSGMRAKLAFGLSMALEFDFYLIDEVTAVGDASFQAKCHAVFESRKARSTLLVVSHNIATIRKHCEQALVLDQGELRLFPDLDQAIAYYQKSCQGSTVYQFTDQNSALPLAGEKLGVG